MVKVIIYSRSGRYVYFWRMEEFRQAADFGAACAAAGYAVEVS